jgi:hypothetical protein
MPTQAYRALGVLDELRRAGLPVRDSVIYAARTDPDGLLGTAGGPEEKVAFIDARVNAGQVRDLSYGSIELGGMVEVYADPTGAAERKDGYTGPCWIFLRGPVLLRLSPRLTEVQAVSYAAAFRRSRIASRTLACTGSAGSRPRQPSSTQPTA